LNTQTHRRRHRHRQIHIQTHTNTSTNTNTHKHKHTHTHTPNDIQQIEYELTLIRRDVLSVTILKSKPKLILKIKLKSNILGPIYYNSSCTSTHVTICKNFLPQLLTTYLSLSINEINKSLL